VDQTPIYAELVDELGVADHPSVVAAACDNGASVDGAAGVDGEQVSSSGELPAKETVRGPQVPAGDTRHPMFDPINPLD
jgi:hypothetical protein